MVDETTSNLRYRNKYPRVYRKVSDIVAAKDGINFPKPQKLDKLGAPVTKTVKGKDGQPDTESPVLADATAHLRAYLATGEAAKAKLAELFTNIATAEPLFVKGERSGGGGKIAQWAVDEANKRIALGDEVVEKVAAVIEENVPGYKVGRDADGNVTPDSLARAIAAFKKHEDAKAKAAVLGKLG